jgi:hypothetical protein
MRAGDHGWERIAERAARIGRRRSPLTNSTRSSSRELQAKPEPAGSRLRSHSRASGDGAKPGAELTAQQLYPKMIKEFIGPALQALGFDGDRYVNGDYAGMVGAQKSRYNTKDKVDFTIHLGAEYAPTGYGYWHTRLPGLMPGTHCGWWTLQTGQPMEPVAREVLAAFHAYG